MNRFADRMCHTFQQAPCLLAVLLSLPMSPIRSRWLLESCTINVAAQSTLTFLHSPIAHSSLINTHHRRPTDCCRHSVIAAMTTEAPTPNTTAAGLPFPTLEATSKPTCKGYVMAHSVHTSPPGTPNDPYAVVPCPHPTSVPPQLGERCKSNPLAKRTCGKCMYCPMHWCGFCKRAVKAAQIAGLGAGTTGVQAQVEELAPVGEVPKVKTD